MCILNVKKYILFNSGIIQKCLPDGPKSAKVYHAL